MEDDAIKIKQIVREYISRESAIIVVLTYALSDLMNCSAINLVLEIDKERKRTIGIRSMLDLYVNDKGRSL